MENNFSWNHNLRNSLWTMLAESFPQAITPIGRVTAAVEPAVLELAKFWPLIAVVDLICSETDCKDFLGSYTCIVEDSLTLSHPINCDLKNKNYNLEELLLDRVNKHVNRVARNKVRCFKSTCGGRATHTGITFENLKIPSFLFLHFFVEGSGNNLVNNFKDSCILKHKLKLGRQQLELLSGLMSSQNHFFTISSLFGNFYKLDNMIQEPYARGFDSFTEAYLSKSDISSDLIPFHLSRKSVRPRKGAVYFVVYKGQDRDEVNEEYWKKVQEFASELSDLPNITFEMQIRSEKPENNEYL